MKFVILVLALLSAACQSEKAAVQVFCDAPVISDPTSRSQAKALEIHLKGIQNGVVLSRIKSTESMTPEARVEAIQALVDEAGVTECPKLERTKKAYEGITRGVHEEKTN